MHVMYSQQLLFKTSNLSTQKIDLHETVSHDIDGRLLLVQYVHMFHPKLSAHFDVLG